jgi:hypothetical protein
VGQINKNLTQNTIFLKLKELLGFTTSALICENHIRHVRDIEENLFFGGGG